MKPHIRKTRGVWTIYAISDPLNSMPLLLAYLFAARLNGDKHYTPVRFIKDL